MDRRSTTPPNVSINVSIDAFLSREAIGTYMFTVHALQCNPLALFTFHFVLDMLKNRVRNRGVLLLFFYVV